MTLQSSQRVVIKIGSNILTDQYNQLDLNNMRMLVQQIAFLKNKNIEVIVVSSGAIVSGSSILGYKPVTMPDKQAAAAIGQTLLLDEYQQFFGIHGYFIAQILLTHDGIIDKIRSDNTKNTMETLLKLKKIVPIVNENDTIATDEIKFSDNDQLSSVVAKLISADYLIILTDIQGLYTQDPRENPKAELISTVSEITEAMIASAGGSSSSKGLGGMKTKLLAAKEALSAGISVTIASGRSYGILEDLYYGKSVGTQFVP